MDRFKRLTFTDHIILIYTYVSVYSYKKDLREKLYSEISERISSITTLADLSASLTWALNKLSDGTPPPCGDDTDLLIEKVIKTIGEKSIVCPTDRYSLEMIFKIYKAHSVTKMLNYILFKFYSEDLCSPANDTKIASYITVADSRSLDSSDGYVCYTIVDTSDTYNNPYKIKIPFSDVLPSFVSKTDKFDVDCHSPLITKYLTNGELPGGTKDKLCIYDEKSTQNSNYVDKMLLLYTRVVNTVLHVLDYSITNISFVNENNCPSLKVKYTAGRDVMSPQIKDEIKTRLILLEKASDVQMSAVTRTNQANIASETRRVFRELLRKYRYDILFLSDDLQSHYDYYKYSPPLKQAGFTSEFKNLKFNQERDGVMSWFFNIDTPVLENNTFLLKSSKNITGALKLLHELTIATMVGREPLNNTVRVVGSFVCTPPSKENFEKTLCSEDGNNLRINMVLAIPDGYFPFSETRDKAVFAKGIINLYNALADLKTLYGFRHNDLNTSNVYVNKEGDVLIGGLVHAYTRELPPLSIQKTNDGINDFIEFIERLPEDDYYKLLLSYRDTVNGFIQDLKDKKYLISDLKKELKVFNDTIKRAKETDELINKNDSEIARNEKELSKKVDVGRKILQTLNRNKKPKHIRSQNKKLNEENVALNIELNELIKETERLHSRIVKFERLYTDNGLEIPALYVRESR